MGNVNSITLSGSIAADPEVRWTSEDGESAIVRLGVIIKESKKDENAENGYSESSSIFDVEVFGKFAKLVARKLKKFDHVSVVGKLVKQEWENDQGEKRSKIVVAARDIDSEGFFRSKADESAPAEQNNPTAPAPEPAAATAASSPSEGTIPF